VLLLLTTAAVTVAGLVMRRYSRREGGTESAAESLTRLEL
jgi:hypothetical protein